jgi:hypothetical protein
MMPQGHEEHEKDESAISAESLPERDAPYLLLLGLGVFRKLEKHPGVATAVAICVYVLGFIVVNVHYARFRLLTFDLLRGEYISAGILFLFFTTAPILAGMYTAGLVLGPALAPGPRLGRVKRMIIWGIHGAFVCVFADIGVAYVFQIVSVATTMQILNVVFSYGILCNMIGFAGLFFPVMATKDDKSDTETMSASEPDALSRVTGIVLGIVGAPAHFVFLLVMASSFGSGVYPGISPAYGGGGAWIAQILTPESDSQALPGKWRGAVLARDDAYLTVIPCTGALPNVSEGKPMEVRLDGIVAWTLIAPVDPTVFLKERAVLECKESAEAPDRLPPPRTSQASDAQGSQGTAAATDEVRRGGVLRDSTVRLRP